FCWGLGAARGVVRCVRPGIGVWVVAALALVVARGAGGARTPPPSYVALGDSYTAGPLIPLQETDPLGCLRSDHNYPHLVAGALGVSGFKDPTSSRAETGDTTN